MIATKKHTFSRDLKTHLLNIILTKCSLTLRRLSMLQTFYYIHDTIIVWQLQYNIIWRRHRLHYDKIHSRTIYHRTLLPHRCCSHLSTDWKCTHFVTSTWYGTIILTVSPLHLLCGPCSSCLLPKTWLTIDRRQLQQLTDTSQPAARCQTDISRTDILSTLHRIRHRTGNFLLKKPLTTKPYSNN